MIKVIFLTYVAQALPATRAFQLGFKFPFDSTNPVAFNISVEPELIDSARFKARHYRPSWDLEGDVNQNWIEGPPRNIMESLAQYWTDHYDWFEVQDEINGNFTHYAVSAPAGPHFEHPVQFHFVHQRSPHEDALPLLLLHGWPSSSLEWSQVIGPLASPGSPASPHFHVVAPDLPGFGFSPAPEYAGLTPREMGFALDNLMRKLGYKRYGLCSTDMGWVVGMWMVHDAAESLIGHMTDFWIQAANETDLERYKHNMTTKEESDYIATTNRWNTYHNGYSDIQRKNPLDLAQALTDSPVGHAGWVLNNYVKGADGFDYSFKQMITRSLALWIGGTYGNLRTYLEFFKPESMNFPKSTVPTGYTRWSMAGGPDPSIGRFQWVPLSWVKRLANLVFSRDHEQGGHFPAEKEPELWVEDVQEFFNHLIQSQF